MLTTSVSSADTNYINLYLSMYETQSVETMKVYENTISGFVRFVGKPLNTVTVGDIIEYQKSISHLAVSTQRRMISTLKSLYKFLGGQPGYLIANPFAVYKLPKEQKNETIERVLSHDEVELIRSYLRSHNTRDWLLVTMLYTTGLRVSELINATWNDVYYDEEGHCGLRVVGKGNKVRYVKLQCALVDALQHYRSDCGLDEVEDAPLFVSRRGTKLTKEAVEQMVRKTVKEVGIHKRVTPHWFRHSAATSALYNGANVHQVQQLLGHSDMRVTSRYVHTINKLRDSAVDFINVEM
ncbi:tyrosine-type recombinase/integrase [Alicyclobacillus acidoterrestris]|uniref:Tyrosine-type recombinase/integrase n=1 Tax=Alicyclobacillus acidoterrestris (strain ATCC 49025 / DSM 3922 / CIP 106132 / NCIMB 13137 / GD3B) TaxID=1356854 RepID=T0D829_ALIAG|nr:tyrosine-type recombinase/integrase [Alicyclobacillus acidoterrestris]EPZ47657.1 hypothetical protein N007_05210 [Alicyclobacillus acidoterrestris ATCC 49025]UNO48025.1 tyrosine-type recombinase/integrase [Alicyclobacillus acidoterrestris]